MQISGEPLATVVFEDGPGFVYITGYRARAITRITLGLRSESDSSGRLCSGYAVNRSGGT